MENIREGRTTVYNDITSPEKLSQVNPENRQLEVDFLEYLASIDRAKTTIYQYEKNLQVFWCWNLEYNNNKLFTKLTKREIAKFQNHAMTVWRWSPRRVRTVKSTISSLSNYIENILDDEYEGYRPIVRKIESPVDTAVRTKTIFEDEDLEELLEILVEDGEYMKACVLSLAMNSGRRKQELPRFKTHYFDDENLICGGSLYKTPEKVKTKGRGTLGKQLELYTLAKSFKPYLDLWLQERERLGISHYEMLFPYFSNGEYKDEELPISTLDSWAETFSRLMGNKNFYWHSLRHYFTTKLSESGLPDGVIQDLIGWSSGDMVKLYTDTEIDKKFEQYFTAEGIANVEKKTLEDL